MRFSDIKVKDRVWSSRFGWGIVNKVHKESEYGITVCFVSAYMNYSFDGIAVGDMLPTLFWNEIKSHSVEEDKQPFDLVEFLEHNLKPKHFTESSSNYSLYYNYIESKWDFAVTSRVEYINLLIFSKDNIEKVVKVLNENKVSVIQLKTIFKKLMWLK